MNYRYYVDREVNNQAEPSPSEIFVYLGNGECYCPVGQHGLCDAGYVRDCAEISREEYINYSGGLYTPEEYLEE